MRKPIRKKAMPERVMFDEREKKAALRVIEKTMRGGQALDRYGGVEVEAYEKEFAAHFGVKFASAVSSGTAAVHSAVAALVLEPGSEIITTPITDPGTVSPIIFQQCVPVFADVEYDTLNISPRSIEKNITKKTKAVVAVHIAGQPAEMGAIMKIAKKHNIAVIEDAAQAHGAKYRGKYAGSIGDMGCFSLMSGKHTTSGGQGGMVITNSEELYWNAKRFADRGKPFNSDSSTNLFAGLNYRMTELEAAIGRVQLKKMGGIMKKRKRIHDALEEGFKEELSAFRLRKTAPGAEPNHWFCFIRADRKKIDADNSIISKAVCGEGIPVTAHYVVPVYKQKWILERNSFGSSKLPWSLPGARKIDYNGSCPEAERALSDHLTLHIHENWTMKEVKDTIKAFSKVEKELGV
jgi:perosamine synthetase